MGDHNAIAVESWQAIAQWDVQTDDEGTAQAVRYRSGPSDPKHMQTLANPKTRVTTASATDAFADSRIANISGLNQYMPALAPPPWLRTLTGLKPDSPSPHLCRYVRQHHQTHPTHPTHPQTKDDKRP